MTTRDLELEQEAERRLTRTAIIAVFSLTIAIAIVNSTSTLMEVARDGGSIHPLRPWLTEGTSALYILLLFFVLLRLERRFPLEAGNWRAHVPIHMGAAVLWSIVHVVAMGYTREAIFPVLIGMDYQFFAHPGPMQVFFYEFRKDLLTYTLQLLTLTSLRTIEWHRLEAIAARREARNEHRLTLKCGGRTMHVEASGFRSAKAAGNYVELGLETGKHLARMTLAELEKQLADAGVDAVRVHRSWLVNRSAITEVRPTGEGDVVLTLANGDTIPGSRRYRDRLDAA